MEHVLKYFVLELSSLRGNPTLRGKQIGVDPYIKGLLYGVSLP